jgi:hypothetical protein
VGRIFRFAVLLSLIGSGASAQKPPLLPEKDVAALAQNSAKLPSAISKASHATGSGSQGFHPPLNWSPRGPRAMA